MNGQFLAGFVHDWLVRDPAADLGEIAAEIVRTSLQRSSRDNVTAMVIQLTDGSDWESESDEMKNHAKLTELLANPTADDEVRKQYANFLRKAHFPPEAAPCAVCSRWNAQMNQCPCKQVYYCKRECQKKGWKSHKPNCGAAVASPSSSVVGKASAASAKAGAAAKK